MMLAANPIVTNLIVSLLSALAGVWPQLIGLAGIYSLLLMASYMGWGAMWRLALRAAQMVGAPVVIDHGEGKLSEEAIVAALEEPRTRMNRDNRDALWWEAAQAGGDSSEGAAVRVNGVTGNASWWEAAQAHGDDDGAGDVKLLDTDVTFSAWDEPAVEPEVDEDEFIENWIRDLARPERDAA